MDAKYKGFTVIHFYSLYLFITSLVRINCLLFKSFQINVPLLERFWLSDGVGDRSARDYFKYHHVARRTEEKYWIHLKTLEK